MSKTINLLAIFALFMVTFLNSSNIIAQGTIRSVKIGKQVWMVENLNVKRFRNGDLIPEAKTNKEWEKAGMENKPAWCYYHNDPVNGKKYGKLYNWYAVNNKKGLAPKGWHIPSLAEFQTLGVSVSGNENALKTIGQGTGTNTSGFSALLAGFRNFYNDFDELHSTTYFWSSTAENTTSAHTLGLHYDFSHFSIISSGKEMGFSVRCLKD